MLTKPIAINVNRGGQSLDTAKQVAEAVGWPVIGVDSRDIVLADAGSAIVGFGFQIQNLQALVVAGTACVAEAEFEQLISIAPTTASTLEFASTSLDADAAKVAKHLEIDTAVATSAKQVAATGRNQLEWTDVNGNASAFVQFDEEGLQDPAGAYYLQLLERRGFVLGKADNQLDNPAPLVGVTLLVSNLGRSREFYEGQLGLAAVAAGPRDVTLDAGNVALRLRAETNLGVMRKTRQARVLRDQYSFYTPNIEAEAANLTSQGIVFPRGIDRSISAGALARFFDPDGHSLWLWQPQPRYVSGMPIDYTPVVSRIVEELGQQLPRQSYTGPVTTTPTTATTVTTSTTETKPPRR